MLNAPPRAKELFGVTPTGFDRLLPSAASRRASRKNTTKRHRSKLIVSRIVNVTGSKTYLADLRTGDASILVMTDAAIPSCQQFASQPSSSSGCGLMNAEPN